MSSSEGHEAAAAEYDGATASPLGTRTNGNVR